VLPISLKFWPVDVREQDGSSAPRSGAVLVSAVQLGRARTCGEQGGAQVRAWVFRPSKAGRSRHLFSRVAKCSHSPLTTHGTHARPDPWPGTATAGFITAAAAHACNEDRPTECSATVLYDPIALNWRGMNHRNQQG
jgi:hypothetical protein